MENKSQWIPSFLPSFFFILLSFFLLFFLFLSSYFFFLFLPQKSLVLCLHFKRGSCKSSSRKTSTVTAELRSQSPSVPRTSTSSLPHNANMMLCDWMWDTGSLPPGREAGKALEIFAVTKAMLYCKVCTGLSLLSRLISHLWCGADLIRAERDYHVVNLFASYRDVMNEGFCSAQPN